jgi:GDP-D-mannose 3', 5'-epimerase
VDVAVTGAGGFIGSHMCKHLLEQGHTVHAFASNIPQQPWRREIWDSCHETKIADLRSNDPVLFGIERLYHFAADMGGVGYFTANDYQPYVNNSRITFHVLHSAAFFKVPRTFVAGSACMYPTNIQMVPNEAPCLHEDLLETGPPDQMYGREKLMMAHLAKRHSQDVRVGILHTIYGEGQEFTGSRVKFPMAAAMKARQARKTGRVSIWGNGSQLRSYLHIDDAIRFIDAIMDDDQNRGPINVGYQGAVSCLDIQRLCNDLADVPNAEIVFDKQKPSGVLGRDCDSTRFRELYGLCETVGYPDGFRRIIEWLDSHDDH